jgi:hypothetical protein
MQKEQVINKFIDWRKDWCLFAKEVLQVKLDKEQAAILRSVQHNNRTTVASGTARGKDFVSAVAALCFLYLTPKWDENGELIENTKVALTAPTDRQIENIMVPEFSRLYQRAKFLPGRLVGYDIRTENKEWFLTGFKADDRNTEAWSGFHAANTMFVVTEASGIPELVYNAIEGNLQGNSRILLVFNPNSPTGYAARSQRDPAWNKFRLDSLNAPNVINRNTEIPGQVDYEWVADKVKNWCTVIDKEDFLEEEGDFEFEIDGITNFYRPNDLFRVKVRGMNPKVSEDTLIPEEWIRLANERWRILQPNLQKGKRLGVDVAGMGRDSSVFCHRYDNYVTKFKSIQSAGKANHMEIAGTVANELKHKGQVVELIPPKAFIDTIGEGAGVYSRLEELGIKTAYSCKYSEAARDWVDRDLKDITGQYEFANMRAYLFWSVRDWLNPVNKMNAALPVDEEFLQEATEIKWKFQSNGKIIIEPKEDIKTRLKRSTDKFDALANTFYPERPVSTSNLRSQLARLI